MQFVRVLHAAVAIMVRHRDEISPIGRKRSLKEGVVLVVKPVLVVAPNDGCTVALDQNNDGIKVGIQALGVPVERDNVPLLACEFEPVDIRGTPDEAYDERGAREGLGQSSIIVGFCFRHGRAGGRERSHDGTRVGQNRAKSLPVLAESHHSHPGPA
jgi:hypothetical protein